MDHTMAYKMASAYQLAAAIIMDRDRRQPDELEQMELILLDFLWDPDGVTNERLIAALRSPSAASSQEKTESGSTVPRKRRKAGEPSR